jgi:hypothetical protein
MKMASAPSMKAQGVSEPMEAATSTTTMKMPSTGAMFDSVFTTASDNPIAPRCNVGGPETARVVSVTVLLLARRGCARSQWCPCSLLGPPDVGSRRRVAIGSMTNDTIRLSKRHSQ